MARHQECDVFDKMSHLRKDFDQFDSNGKTSKHNLDLLFQNRNYISEKAKKLNLSEKLFFHTVHKNALSGINCFEYDYGEAVNKMSCLNISHIEMRFYKGSKCQRSFNHVP